MIGQPARSGHQSTEFIAVARDYGLAPLLLTPGVKAAAGPAVLVGLLVALGALGQSALASLGLGLIICSTALFALVLAILSTGASIFDRPYAEALDRVGTLRPALFAFWWTAALAAGALVAAVCLAVVAEAQAPVALAAAIAGIASFLGLCALLETLALGGTIMRHSLYRALVAADAQEAEGSADA